MNVLRDAIQGMRQGAERRRDIAKNLEVVEALERGAVRITHGPAGRCFQMGDGALFAITNEQPRGSDIHYLQWSHQLTREDAEDFYGWTSTPEWEASFYARLDRGEVPAS